jgi:putative ABC transport system permease protein
METRLLRAALWRKRGTAALAVFAVAIGASVASALLQVSGDVSRQLTHELRALGPNLLVFPPAAHGGASHYLDEATARERMARAGVEGAVLLYAVARIGDRPVQIVGADLDAVRRAHPSWAIGDGPSDNLVGTRLAKRLGLAPGMRATLAFPAGSRTLDVVAGATLEAGGPDDDAWWLPLRDVQALAGLPGRASLAQVRIEGGEESARAVAAALERGGALRAEPLHALSRTEAELLARMRGLMTLVTVAALAAAGLCAFGTMMDLALERRREIALMKALGASKRDVVRLFAAESFAIGLAGGVLGWLLGLGFAVVIAREVFHTSITLRWDVPPLVISLAIATSVLAGLGPIRLALGIEPAAALKGE